MADGSLGKQQLAHKPGKQRHTNHGQGAHGKADARNFMAVGGSPSDPGTSCCPLIRPSGRWPEINSRDLVAAWEGMWKMLATIPSSVSQPEAHINITYLRHTGKEIIRRMSFSLDSA